MAVIESQTVLPYTREPLYHIGISSGKDSTALLLWAIHKSGLPRNRLRVTFCDTGNEDPITYAHLELIRSGIIEPAKLIGGLETLIPPLQFFDLCFKKGRFPSRVAQFCSIELKIAPTKAWVRQQWAAGEDVVLLNGKRVQESAERARKMHGKPARGFSDYWGCEEWAPIREWSFDQVIAIHREFDFPLNPLYAMGARRVGCWPCINCGKEEIRLVAKHRPEKIDQIENEESRFVAELGRVSTFFHAKTTARAFRDTAYTDTDGKVWPTATIRSVVKWAHTKRGGKEPWVETAAPACHEGYLSCE